MLCYIVISSSLDFVTMNDVVKAYIRRLRGGFLLREDDETPALPCRFE